VYGADTLKTSVGACANAGWLNAAAAQANNQNSTRGPAEKPALSFILMFPVNTGYQKWGVGLTGNSVGGQSGVKPTLGRSSVVSISM